MQFRVAQRNSKMFFWHVATTRVVFSLMTSLKTKDIMESKFLISVNYTFNIIKIAAFST